jgi:hypothetical protein
MLGGGDDMTYRIREPFLCKRSQGDIKAKSGDNKTFREKSQTKQCQSIEKLVKCQALKTF